MNDVQKKVLISCDIDPGFIRKLEAKAYRVNYQPTIVQADLENIIKDYTGLIVSTNIKVRESLIDKAHRLKWLGRAGSGMENIDTSLANAKNIYCFNSPEGNRNAVAEHALGMLLNLFRNITLANQQIRNGIWKREENRGIELHGLNIGIIGFGNTGNAFAQKLQGFSVNVYANDKYKSGFGRDYIRECSLQKLYEVADIISLHIPLNGETMAFADKTFFSNFAKPIIFINTSRGKVVNTNDLLEALDSGRVRGACLDVFETEPLQAKYLKNNSWYQQLILRDNVILTPHIAGWTHASKKKIGKVLLEKLQKQGF